MDLSKNFSTVNGNRTGHEAYNPASNMMMISVLCSNYWGHRMNFGLQTTIMKCSFLSYTSNSMLSASFTALTDISLQIKYCFLFLSTCLLNYKLLCQLQQTDFERSTSYASGFQPSAIHRQQQTGFPIDQYHTCLTLTQDKE